MGNKQKGGAVFVSGTPKKCRAAKIRAALVGQLVFARLAIPRPDHIKAIVAELFHMLFFFFAPAGIFDVNRRGILTRHVHPKVTHPRGCYLRARGRIFLRGGEERRSGASLPPPLASHSCPACCERRRC